MTNASCTLTPAPVMRCGCIGALILSATGRAHISGEYARPIVPLSGFARKHPSQHRPRLHPGDGKPGCLLLSNKGTFFSQSPHMSALLQDTDLRASQLKTNDRGPPEACQKRLRRPGLRPHFIKRSKKTRALSPLYQQQDEGPQIPGEWVSVPSRGCYAARCQCDAPGLAGWPNRTVVRAGSHSRRWTAWYHSRRQIYSRGVMGA